MISNTWNSNFRKERFLNNRKKDSYYGPDIFGYSQREKVIVIMIDAANLKGLDDEKAKLLMMQLVALRRKFNTQKTIINISTNLPNPEILTPYMKILERNLTSKIELSNITFLNGTFDYKKQKNTYLTPIDINRNKINAFRELFLHNSDYLVEWFAIIDNSITKADLKFFKGTNPMAAIKVACDKDDIKEDNLMLTSTQTEGILGVIEGLNTYLEKIKNIAGYDVINAQKDVLFSLGYNTLNDIFNEKNYKLLIRYLNEQELKQPLYEWILREVYYTLQNDTNTNEDTVLLGKILEMVIKKLDDTNPLVLRWKKEQ